MAHAQILHIRAAPNHDAIHIAAQHRVTPNGSIVGYHHLANDLTGVVQKNIAADDGGSVEVRGKWHGEFLFFVVRAQQLRGLHDGLL
jgi:hypothetical protein